MEDGIESSGLTLYEYDKIIAKKKELDSYACLYTHKQHNGEFIIFANKDKAIAAKEAELEKVKADQALQVNNATTALNNALQKAATSK